MFPGYPINNMAQARDYLRSFVDFERRGLRRHFANVVTLDTIRSLLDSLGNPQAHLCCVHIAGTKGKGSVAAALEAALRRARYRTGLYTSPHLVTPTERIRVAGAKISDEHFVEVVRAVQPAVEQVRKRSELPAVTFFEIYTAMALLSFRRAGVDVAVIEAGLGGRLDATNLVIPDVSIITVISYDHTEILGTTVPQIAAEKAGIIKPHTPVVLAPQVPEARRVLLAEAKQRQAPVIVPPSVHEYGQVTPLTVPASDEALARPTQKFALSVEKGDLWVTTPLIGEHQAGNAALAYAALGVLRETGFDIQDRDFVIAMRELNWPGRIQLVAARPWIVVDCAHNPASAAALAATLPRHFSYDRLIMVVGISADKDVGGIIQALAEVADEFIVTQANIPRGMPVTELLQVVRSQWKGPTDARHTVAEALSTARQVAGPADAICVTGSFFVAGEAMVELGIEP